jgi:hypothetical protein
MYAMNWSDIVSLVADYETAMWSPTRMSVQFGCECGCGGDSYTKESWDEEEHAAHESIDAAIAFCEKHGITYDGIE